MAHKSEVDLEYYLSFLEKVGIDFSRLKNVGLLSWRVSRVFNKVGSIKPMKFMFIKIKSLI